jgi:hypothetical protein
MWSENTSLHNEYAAFQKDVNGRTVLGGRLAIIEKCRYVIIRAPVEAPYYRR